MLPLFYSSPSTHFCTFLSPSSLRFPFALPLLTASSSSSWVNIYTTYFLQIAGVKQPFSYSVLVTCTGLIGVLVSFFFVRLIDRRTVMLVGITACAICQLIPAIAWTKSPGSESTGRVVVAFIALFTFFYVAYGECFLSFGFHNQVIRLTTPESSSVRMAPRRRIRQ